MLEIYGSRWQNKKNNSNQKQLHGIQHENPPGEVRNNWKRCDLRQLYVGIVKIAPITVSNLNYQLIYQFILKPTRRLLFTFELLLRQQPLGSLKHYNMLIAKHFLRMRPLHKTMEAKQVFTDGSCKMTLQICSMSPTNCKLSCKTRLHHN